MKKALTFTLFILLILGIAVFSVSRADYNWDVLPYAGCVFSLQSNDAEFIHKSAYDLFKSTVNEKTYQQQTSGSYREAMAACTECFYQTLPFYKIKILYIGLIYTLYKAGVNLFFAPFVLQGIFYFLISLVVYLWIWKISANAVYSFVLSALLCVSPYFLINLSNANPDMLACFLLLFAVYYLIEENNVNLFLLLMVLCVAVRADNIFLFAILIGVLAANKQFAQHKKLMYLSAALSIIIVIVLNVYSRNYGYSTLFYHSFVERLTRPAEFNSAITPTIYFKGLLNWIFFFKYSILALQLVFLSVVIYIKLQNHDNIKNDLEFLILIAMGLSIVIHYIIYPIMDDRYFMGQYLVIDILFIKTVFAQRRTLKNITH